MFPTLLDRTYHFLDNKTVKIQAFINKKKLNFDDFCIVSNNCWGGVCYEHYGLQKRSPTVGMYFYPEDYLKLIANVKYYFSQEMVVVESSKSKHIETLIQDKVDKYYIGIIDDIEAVLVHFSDPELAAEKWKRRAKRANFNNLVFKFSQQNHCMIDHLKRFDEMDLPGKKFMFIKDPNLNYSCGVYYKGFENRLQIDNDTFYWNRYFDVTDFLNGNGLHN